MSTRKPKGKYRRDRLDELAAELAASMTVEQMAEMLAALTGRIRVVDISQLPGSQLWLRADCCTVLVTFDHAGSGLTVEHDDSCDRPVSNAVVGDLVARAVEYATGVSAEIVPMGLESAGPVYVSPN